MTKKAKKYINKTTKEVTKKQMRQVIIETDGNMIKVVKNETSGNLELAIILKSLLSQIIVKKEK